MHLFLLLSVPALYLGLRSGAIEREARGDGLWLVAGMAVAVPTLVLEWLISGIRHPIGPVARYFVVTLDDHLLLHAVSVVSWLLIRGFRQLEDEAGRRRWFDFFAFSTGLYGVVSLYLSLVLWGGATFYTIALLPLLRLSALLVTSVLVILFFEAYGIYRALYALAVLLTPFVLGAAAYLARINRLAPATAVTLAIAAGASFLWWRRESC